MTLSDLQGIHQFSYQMAFFVLLCSSWQDLNWYTRSFCDSRLSYMNILPLDFITWDVMCVFCRKIFVGGLSWQTTTGMYIFWSTLISLNCFFKQSQQNNMRQTLTAVSLISRPLHTKYLCIPFGVILAWLYRWPLLAKQRYWAFSSDEESNKQKSVITWKAFFSMS